MAIRDIGEGRRRRRQSAGGQNQHCPPAQGLLDPETNLTYAVPYLANAYKIAGGNETRGMALFSSGYYYTSQTQEVAWGIADGIVAQAKAPEAYP